MRDLYEPSCEHDACGVAAIAQLDGTKSREVVTLALSALERMEHRGACGSDPETGDGAGILVQLPHRFFKRIGLSLGFQMPRRRRYGVGQLFLPQDERRRIACEAIFEEIIRDEGQRLIGWRDVPVDRDSLGPLARASAPVFRQVWIERRRIVPSEFERKLYVIRKRVESEIERRELDPNQDFHVASLSTETIVYKGLLKPDQLAPFYPDLSEPDFVSAIAMVHSRFSTNTLPRWRLAQPLRRLCHNGEINTIRGNVNWMRARYSNLQSAKFFGSLERLQPIIDESASDSARFDNILELLHLGGRSLPHAAMMMIPEAWEGDRSMSPQLRAFYEYSATLLEPWDGPAALCFSDGHVLGATLDRNGLRPARYQVTRGGLLALASESGAVELPAEEIILSKRLQPGEMLVVDTEEGEIIPDAILKRDIAGRYPYQRWLKKNQLHLSDLPLGLQAPRPAGDRLRRLQCAAGYSEEELRRVLTPMILGGKEPLGSMGDDTPIALLSDQSPPLSHYFKQLFAQVTNPPIDPLRESLVMSLRSAIGAGANTFEETPESCHQIISEGPILTAEELARIEDLDEGQIEVKSLSTCFPRDEGERGLRRALDRLCAAAVEAIDEGNSILILSDRALDHARAAIPSVLAVSAVHHHLIREGIRLRAGVIVDCMDCWSTHQLSLLLAYGAAAVHPSTALATVSSLAEKLKIDQETALSRYRKALEGGLLKVMSKMGISTLASYRGAQIFECLGLSPRLVERHFTGTASRIGGLELEGVCRELLSRHHLAFPEKTQSALPQLPPGGLYSGSAAESVTLGARARSRSFKMRSVAATRWRLRPTKQKSMVCS
ncbi:MAG: glutamate synthase central domain-containing protein [Myxococcota bacterium]|nr:glutamate synthase central domain-containing protein [Myxococcota bacterium]